MKPVKLKDMIHKLKKTLFGEKQVNDKLKKVNENMELIKQFHCIKNIVNN